MIWLEILAFICGCWFYLFIQDMWQAYKDGKKN